MALSSELNKNITGKDVKAFFVAVGPLIVIVVLTFFISRTVISKIGSQRQTLQEAERTENILSQKKELLSNFEGQTQDPVSSAVIAVPGINSAPAVLSQIKILASERLLFLTNLKSGSAFGDKAGFSKVKIQFDLDGDIFILFDFLNALDEVSPLVIVDAVNINALQAPARASVSLTHSFADFPKKLPPITQPLQDLTSSELELLTILSSLRQPSFFDIEPDDGETTRENPFE